MAINITDENFYQYLEEGGEAIENKRQIPVMEEDEIDYTVSMPAVKYDKDPSVNTTAKPVEWRQVYWKTFWNKILEGYQMCVDASSDLTDLITLCQEATTAANAAADASAQATEEASNVNADLTGMTVTITDRYGVSNSVNIGFEIYRTYSSVALMNADAANVPEGKFVMIATTDTTSVENARLYGRNSQPATAQEPFTFLSDLDQASSSAWAEWLNTYTPAIIQATTDANNAATIANTKAALAQTAADNADASRLAIEANEQTRQSNEAARVAAETQRQSDWTAFFSDTLATGCRYLWNNFWTSINSLWTGFWGTSADDPNGVRKQWSDLHADATADHVQAGQDHNRANVDHTTADSDHTTAGLDHTTAGQDHTASTQATSAAIAQKEILEEWNTHQPFIGDGTTGDANYWYIYDTTNDTYVRSVYAKGDDLHWGEMTEAEKEDLARRVLDQIAFDDVPTAGSDNAVKSGGIYNALATKQDTLTFASNETCESIIEELT